MIGVERGDGRNLAFAVDDDGDGDDDDEIGFLRVKACGINGDGSAQGLDVKGHIICVMLDVVFLQRCGTDSVQSGSMHE